METIDDLVALIRDELGLELTSADAGRQLGELPGWDSVHLLWMLTSLERITGRSLSLPDLLEASSLENIYALIKDG